MLLQDLRRNKWGLGVMDDRCMEHGFDVLLLAALISHRRS